MSATATTPPPGVETPQQMTEKTEEKTENTEEKTDETKDVVCVDNDGAVIEGRMYSRNFSDTTFGIDDPVCVVDVYGNGVKLRFKCELCEVLASSARSLKDHFEGSIHIRNVKQKGGLAFAAKVAMKRGAGTNLDVLAKLPKLEPPPAGETTKSFLENVLHTHKEPLIGLQFIDEYQNTATTNDPDYWCKLCDKTFNMKSVVSHVTGVTHRMKYLEENYPGYVAELNEKGAGHFMCKQYAERIDRDEGRRKVNVLVHTGPTPITARDMMMSQARAGLLKPRPQSAEKKPNRPPSTIDGVTFEDPKANNHGLKGGFQRPPGGNQQNQQWRPQGAPPRWNNPNNQWNQNGNQMGPPGVEGPPGMNPNQPMNQMGPRGMNPNQPMNQMGPPGTNPMGPPPGMNQYQQPNGPPPFQQMGPRPPMGPNQGPPMGPNQGPPMGPNQGPPMGPNQGPPMGPNQGPPMGYNQGPPMGPNQGPPMGPNQGPPMGPNQGPPMGPNQVPPPMMGMAPSGPPPNMNAPQQETMDAYQMWSSYDWSSYGYDQTMYNAWYTGYYQPMYWGGQTSTAQTTNYNTTTTNYNSASYIEKGPTTASTTTTDSTGESALQPSIQMQAVLGLRPMNSTGIEVKTLKPNQQLGSSGSKKATTTTTASKPAAAPTPTPVPVKEPFSTIKTMRAIMVNADRLINNEEEAGIALQASNVLTQALLNYRLKSVPKEILKSNNMTKLLQAKRREEKK